MSTEGTGHEDADGEERVDSALADDIESAFNGVVLNESGNPVASAEATGEAGPGAADDGARAVQDSGNAGDTADSGQAGESELDRARAEAARAADDLARARADLYNLQQEYRASCGVPAKAPPGTERPGRRPSSRPSSRCSTTSSSRASTATSPRAR